jgi:hypothetical protein
MVTDRVLAAAEFRARRLGRSLVQTTFAAICGVLASSFLTAAVWLALSDAWGPIAACALVGLGFALIALALVLIRPRTPPPPPPPKVGLDDLAQAFVMAAEVARSVRRR